MSVWASDLLEPEAPVLLPDGSLLCVEMDPARGSVVRLSADGSHKSVLASTGRPNGLAVDRHDSIWVAESRYPCVLRMTLAGEIEARVDQVDGRPMLFPNDIAIGADGMLWVTDSGVRYDAWSGADRDDPALEVDGRIYRVDPGTLRVTRFEGGLQFANGIAWGPDGRLYANETVTGAVYAYELRPDGGLGPREELATVVRPEVPGGPGPDGMKFAADGNLYCTVFGQGEVCVIAPGGGIVERLPTAGARPTNLVFGPAGSGVIYVTEVELGQIEVIDVGVDGLALFS